MSRLFELPPYLLTLPNLETSTFHFGAVLALFHAHYENGVVEVVQEDAPDFLSFVKVENYGVPVDCSN